MTTPISSNDDKSSVNEVIANEAAKKTGKLHAVEGAEDTTTTTFLKQQLLQQQQLQDINNTSAVSARRNLSKVNNKV